jgi:hypothetical protein
MNKLSLLLAAALLLGCPPPPPCPNCPNPDFPDAGPARSACQRACEHFRELKCEEGEPTKDGATCETVCENMQTSNLISYDLDCAAKAPTCDYVDSCPRK